VQDANVALKAARTKLVSELTNPGKALSKETAKLPGAIRVHKLAASDPQAAQLQAEVLAWQEHADKETNFLKNISRTFGNQVRSIHTHQALNQFLDMTAKDSRELAIKTTEMDGRQIDAAKKQGYKAIDDPRFQSYLFHPDLQKNLERYIDHVKLPHYPDLVAADGRKLALKIADHSPAQIEELMRQGYHELENPLLKSKFLVHPNIEKYSDLMSEKSKYWWGNLTDPSYMYNKMLNLEGKSIAAIMFSPLVHGLNIASRWGMGYLMNPQEMTHYLFQQGGKPWNKDEASWALRSEAYNSGLVPHHQNHSYADNLLSTMSDSLGDLEEQLPKALKADDRRGRWSQLWEDRPRPMHQVNNHFWGAVNDFGVMMYHMEKTGALKAGMLEQDAREFAARRANSWMGAVAPEDTNPLLHSVSRLLMFAPNWWRTWAELMVPMYKRAGFLGDNNYLRYRAYQSAKTVAAAVAFQKMSGEILNYLGTSSTPWAHDGHWQQQNQQQNKDKIEATGNWLGDIPGIDFFAPASDPKTGAVRTFENPFGRQQFATEQAAGMQEGTPYWQPEDTWDGMAKFVTSRTSPLLDAAFGATNIDLYQSVADHQLRAVDTAAPAGSISPGSLLTGAMMMTPVGLNFAQNVQKSSAQGSPNALESALGTRVPKSYGELFKDLGNPTLRMLFSWFTGVNSPYDTSQKTRGIKPSDQDYQRVSDLNQAYQKQMSVLSNKAWSGQITPSQWRSQYAQLAAQHGANMESLFKGSPEYVNGAEGMLNDYMGLYNDPRVLNPDGSINQDQLTNLQNQFRHDHTKDQLQQMQVLQRQNDQKYPMLAMYHKMLDNYQNWQQTWASQNNVDYATLRKETSEFASLYGDQRASQQYLRQHPELNRYERAKKTWERTPAGMLYSFFYNPSAVSNLMRSGANPTQTALRLAEGLPAVSPNG
jgi:hypothetical protein